MSIQRLRRHKSRFTVFQNDVFDLIQGPEAKLVWVYLLTKPDNWRINNLNVRNSLKIGLPRYRKAVKELRELRLLEDVYLRENRRIIAHEVVLNEVPGGYPDDDPDDGQNDIFTSCAETYHRREPNPLIKTNSIVNTNKKEKKVEKKERQPSQGSNSGIASKEAKPLSYDHIENLNQEAWNDWIAYRKLCKLKAYKTDRQAKKLATLPSDKQAECVEYSMTNEYAGLFTERFEGKDDNWRERLEPISDAARRELEEAGWYNTD